MKFTKLALRVIEPKSSLEDIRRREFILNIFVVSISLLLAVAVVTSSLNLLFFSDVTDRANNAISLGVLGVLFVFFTSLLILSKRGFVLAASYILLGALLTLAGYLGYRWGVDVTASVIFYALVIVMSGILISTRFAFLATMGIAVIIGTIAHLQAVGAVVPNRAWTVESWRMTDVIFTSVLFLIIATVSWLSNREIEQSLARARKSERELKEERDMLEVRVEERTKELRAAESEKIAQAYRFIEFGRIAGGLFHDLVNPLAAISLNIQIIANSQKDGKAEALVEDVERATAATEHMRSLMDSMRKHLAHDMQREMFSIRGVIADVVRVLEGYARPRHVRLQSDIPEDVSIFGNATQFTQVMTNLLSNAIESFPERGGAREVAVSVSRKGEVVEIHVRDTGSGIAPEDLPRIFEPFFSTKGTRGLGIGLSLTRRIIEKEFNGTLDVTSEHGKGSHFMIRLSV